MLQVLEDGSTFEWVFYHDVVSFVELDKETGQTDVILHVHDHCQNVYNFAFNEDRCLVLSALHVPLLLVKLNGHSDCDSSPTLLLQLLFLLVELGFVLGGMEIVAAI